MKKKLLVACLVFAVSAPVFAVDSFLSTEATQAANAASFSAASSAQSSVPAIVKIVNDVASNYSAPALAKAGVEMSAPAGPACSEDNLYNNPCYQETFSKLKTADEIHHYDAAVEAGLGFYLPGDARQKVSKAEYDRRVKAVMAGRPVDISGGF